MPPRGFQPCLMSSLTPSIRFFGSLPRTIVYSIMLTPITILSWLGDISAHQKLFLQPLFTLAGGDLLLSVSIAEYYLQ